MTRYIQKSSYETTHLDNEYIILNTEDYTVTKLNDVGGFCWFLLQEEQTVESLAKAVEEEYKVGEVQVSDIDEFISQLKECGLIKYAI